MAPASDSAARPADPIISRTVLGNYVVDKKLGEGGMGSVYLLRHRILPNTLAALKVIGADRAASATAAARFQQEALVAASIGSHRVVRPIDVGCFDDGIDYIVMEYVAGRTLAEELAASGPLEPAVALRVAVRVAETLVAVHAEGFIHRDIKPGNIMVTREANDDFAVRVFDFGVALPPENLKVAQTRENAIVGTAGYMPPEALESSAVDGRADVFSLGVTLFQTLTGQLPFAAPNLHEAMANVLTRDAPRATERRPAHLSKVPAEVDDLLTAALAKDFAVRPTMAEWLTAAKGTLARLEDSVGTGTAESPLAPAPLAPTPATVEPASVAATTTADAPAPARLKRGSLPLHIAIPAVAVVALGAVLVMRSPSSTRPTASQPVGGAVAVPRVAVAPPGDAAVAPLDLGQVAAPAAAPPPDLGSYAPPQDAAPPAGPSSTHTAKKHRPVRPPTTEEVPAGLRGIQ